MVNSAGKLTQLPVAFPSDFVVPSEKNTNAYGLKYGKAIWDTFFNSGGYTIRRRKIQELKRWAEGRQSVDDMKKLWGLGTGDTSYANIDWEAPSIAAHLVDVLSGLILNQQFRPVCKAVDNISLSKKDEEYNKLKAAYLLKGADKELVKNGLPPIAPPGVKQFDSLEELDLYFELNFKQAVEMAMELGIEVVLSNNEIEEIKKSVIKNLITVKQAGIRVYYSKQNTIKLKSLDPEFLILPYSQKPDHKDTNYWGYIDFMTIGELKQRAGGQFTEDHYKSMAKKAGSQWANPVWTDWYYSDYRYLNFLIPVMEFEFLSINTEKWVSINNKYGNRRTFLMDDKYDEAKGKEAGHTIQVDDIQQKYSGFYVVGTDYIFDYGLSKNMIFKKINNTYANETPLSAIVYTPDIYENTNKSLLERLLPHAKQCHLALLKIQQIQATARPKGALFDISAFTGIKLGAGKDDPDATILELMKFFDETGNILSNRINDDGKEKNGRSVIEMENGMSADLERYINSYEFNVRKMGDIIGANSAVDASTVSKEAAVGVQKLQVNATINSLRPLKSAYVNIMQRSCNNTALMIQDCLRYNNGGEDIFINSLGNRTTEVLEAIKDIPLTDYAISIEYQQDEQDRQEFNRTVEISLEQQLIEPSDVYAIKTITNTKVAYAFLKERERKIRKQRQEEAAQNSQMQSQGSIEAAKAAEQSRMQTEVTIRKAESELEMVKTQEAIKLEKEKSELRKQEMQLEYQLKTGLAVKIEETKTTSDNKMVQTSDIKK